MEKQGLTPSDTDSATIVAEQEVKDSYWKHNTGMSALFDRKGTPYFKAMPEQGAVPLKAVENYGMPAVEHLYERDLIKRPDALGFDNEDDLRTFWAQKANPKGEIKLQDSTGLGLTFPKILCDQTIKKGHWNIAKSAFVLLKNADEIWGALELDRSPFRKYIGYYQHKPLVLLADQDGVVQTFYAWDKPLTELENLREGLLIKRR